MITIPRGLKDTNLYDLLYKSKNYIEGQYSLNTSVSYDFPSIRLFLDEFSKRTITYNFKLKFDSEEYEDFPIDLNRLLFLVFDKVFYLKHEYRPIKVGNNLISKELNFKFPENNTKLDDQDRAVLLEDLSKFLLTEFGFYVRFYETVSNRVGGKILYKVSMDLYLRDAEYKYFTKRNTLNQGLYYNTESVVLKFSEVEEVEESLLYELLGREKDYLYNYLISTKGTLLCKHVLDSEKILSACPDLFTTDSIKLIIPYDLKVNINKLEGEFFGSSNLALDMFKELLYFSAFDVYIEEFLQNIIVNSKITRYLSYKSYNYEHLQ